MRKETFFDAGRSRRVSFSGSIPAGHQIPAASPTAANQLLFGVCGIVLVTTTDREPGSCGLNAECASSGFEHRVQIRDAEDV